MKRPGESKAAPNDQNAPQDRSFDRAPNGQVRIYMPREYRWTTACGVIGLMAMLENEETLKRFISFGLTHAAQPTYASGPQPVPQG